MQHIQIVLMKDKILNSDDISNAFEAADSS
jgi:hypothetical protein